MKCIKRFFVHNQFCEVPLNGILVVNGGVIDFALVDDLSSRCIHCTFTLTHCISVLREEPTPSPSSDSTGPSGAPRHPWFRRCPWASRYHSDASSKCRNFPRVQRVFSVAVSHACSVCALSLEHESANSLLHLLRWPHSIASGPKDGGLIFFGLQITCIVNVSRGNGVEPVTEALKGLVTHICVCVCRCVSRL